MSHQYRVLEDTVYFGFVSNDTGGSAVDGSTPLFDVRLAGAAASAAPVLSGTPDLLTHANYGPGCYEVAIAATDANGFAAGSTYLVFVTVTADSETPGACLGSFTLDPVPANVTEVSDDATAADNLESACDNYSATRGLAGTALPAAAADAAGGLPISDAGGLDLDTFLGRIDATLTDRTLAAAGYFDPAADTVNVALIEGSDATDQIAGIFVTYGLDHLISSSVTSTDIADGSIIARLASKSATPDWDSFDNTSDSLEAIADQAIAIAADGPQRPTKGVALSNLQFLLVDTDGAPVTDLTPTVEVSQDAGAFSAATNAPAEISDGWYQIDLTAAEMNADTVAVRFSGTGAVEQGVTIVTQPT